VLRAGALLDRIFQQERINFALTNRVPRRALTRFMGWFSTIEQPLVRDLSIAMLQFFAGDLCLCEARKREFSSLRDCFIRQLENTARPIDVRPHVLVSPCDGIVGACGRIDGTTLVQAKGFEYPLEDLVGDPWLAERYRTGTYATLRLTASMYHRFHAPANCHVARVLYISGDTWNVNPIALRRVVRLFCKNERAVVPINLAREDESITLVAVGAILVASIRLNFLEIALSQRYTGPNRLSCSASFQRGQEMGYFEHGSTIIVLARPGFALTPGLQEGDRIRMGEPLFEHVASTPDA
jgi:phosphatidylserine decarboxylase